MELPDYSFFRAVSHVVNVAPEKLLHRHKTLVGKLSIGEGYGTRRLAHEENLTLLPSKDVRAASLKVFDLFCGSGGFSYGFEKTGEFDVIGGIDLLPDRTRSFSTNHPTATGFCADIKNASFKDLLDLSGSPDVVIAGPPCQGFSSIRPFRTLTEKDPRNNLYEYCALFVDYVKPRWFVLENVVGLTTSLKGATFKNVVKIFETIGYTVKWNILNVGAYGLPQRRERFILVASRDGEAYEWPNPTHYINARSMAGNKYKVSSQQTLFSKLLLPATTVLEAIHDLPEIRAGEKASHYRQDIKLTPYERELRGNTEKLTLHEATHHSEKMLNIIKHAGYSRSALPKGLTTSGFSSSYSRLEPDLPSVTLTVNFVHPASNKCIHPYQDRALTPREGARLQGFDDSFRFIGTKTQIVKQIGNAVPPLLGKIIAESLLRSH